MSGAATTTAVPRPLPWRKRLDLRTVDLEFSGQPTYGVKDPVTLRYFELNAESAFVLHQLNGQVTAEEICRAFHERFRPRTLSETELQGFLGRLLMQGLIVSDRPGQGRLLVARDQELQSRRRWSQWVNLLAIRFRGFDPDRLLTTLNAGWGWLFAPWSLVTGLLLILSALTLVTVQFDELVRRLPDAQALLTVPNLIVLSLLLAVVKGLHELGHGMTCKRFGGECRELGVMLLMLTPTLYCNVSDIWMLRSKWQRMAVSAAGMWVEALIAATCTLLWWFSAPGLFHSLCLNLMFVCGVSTFLFNGNPLLRYDGYFVLADWLEIPNLREQASATVRGTLAQWYCGMPSDPLPDHSVRRYWGLLAYGVASPLYRLLITGLMLWGLYRWLEPLGLGSVVQLVTALTLGAMLAAPVLHGVRFLRAPMNRSHIRWGRFTWLTGLTVGLLTVLLLVPWPCGVTAGALVTEDDTQQVYVSRPGTLIDSVTLGETVEAGQIIARLVEPALEVSLVELEGELNQQRLRLDHLERRRVVEPQVAATIPAVREVVLDLEQQLAQRQQDAERLVLRAPRAGMVLPAPQRLDRSVTQALPPRLGSPLELRNRGCYLPEGTALCQIGPLRSRSAIVVIHQNDISQVSVGQTVRCVWNELAGEILTGQIRELSALDLDQLSPQMGARLNLPLRSSSTGEVRPVGTWYQARVQLDETDSPLLRGSAGIARISVDRQSLLTRLLRWLKQTFTR